MKWKKENNIKSLNDPSVKIDSTSSDHNDSNGHHSFKNQHNNMKDRYKSDED